MKFLAILEVTRDQTIITLDRATVLDTNGVPLTQAMIKDFVLCKDSKSSANEVMKEWEQENNPRD